ncbi:MAG TPA: hypothetical protein VGB18_08850, partial [Candidatus Thermoplasmatota archaeon]
VQGRKFGDQLGRPWRALHGVSVVVVLVSVLGSDSVLLIGPSGVCGSTRTETDGRTSRSRSL